jgi:signal transduction histidine kinase
MDESNCQWIKIQNESVLLLDFSGLPKKSQLEKILKIPGIENVALNGGSKEINFSINEDETVWIQAVGCHFNMQEKRTLLLVLADITAEKNVDELISKKEKEIQRLKQQKDDFMIQVGHDLKTPLTPLLSILPLIRKKSTDQQTKELLDAAIINTEQLKQHVDKILKYAKIKAFGTDYDMKDISLQQTVSEVIRSFTSKLSEKHLRVHNEIDDEIEVRADKARLNELFSQFFSNSIKFTKKKGEITVFAERTGEMITVSFQDTGSGLNKTQVDHIFNEFYKADDSRHDMNSSGLGLAMCKTIVTKHGGRIWAFSMGDGQGVTFYFTLPIAKNQRIQMIK